LVSIFAHAYMGAINEYWHVEEDKNNPQFKYKPLVTGKISKRNALIFAAFCYLMAIILSFIFYPNYFSLVAIVLAGAFGTFYTVKGKYISWLYDFSPSVGAFFLVIYGALTKGDITKITIIAAICAFFVSVYGEWIGGMKDVDIDKKFHVKTTAVRWNYSYKKDLSIKDVNFIYFIWIVISIDFTYSIPFVLNLLSPTYFYIFLFIGLPLQAYLIYRLYGKQNKESLRKHPMIFIGTMVFLSFVLVIDKITIWGVIASVAFVVGWVYVLSLFGISFSRG